MKKIAAINDLSGIGRCSLTVALPIISALKVQCCPFPTAILSSQTGYPEYTFLDFTNNMSNYYSVWKNLNINFDCIYSGFLGSKEQIDIVCKFICENKDSFVIVDPVMGDEGKLYPVFDIDMCKKIKNLVKHADLVTPNLTEACLLTDNEYKKDTFSELEIINIAKDICKLGPRKVIITGIISNDNIINLAYDKDLDKYFVTSIKYNNKSYSGTGDIFTSIVSGLLMRDYSLEEATKEATMFISEVVNYTSQFDTDRNDGVIFEQFLNMLTSL
ncbi:pyridoxamine kinase [Romboutsia lituseburensis]|uniref:pyridoxamine kinase n=1 Tax=Romboutsia lituseburensis TaxID=1537 RepID=UPI002ED2CAAC